MNFPYEDIVHLPHHVSKRHKPMPRADRAAQFAPFAALTGHDDAVKEAARLTDSESDISESGMDSLDRRHQILLEHLAEHPEVTFTFFVPDSRKDGGAYHTKTGNVKKIDEYGRAYILTDKSIIPMEHLLSMESDLFGDGDIGCPSVLFKPSKSES